MPSCNQCGRTISLPFNCKFCNNTFCSKHRLPENHNCSGLKKWKENNIPPLEYFEALRRSKKYKKHKGKYIRLKKPIYKKISFWIFIILILIIFLVNYNPSYLDEAKEKFSDIKEKVINFISGEIEEKDVIEDKEYVYTGRKLKQLKPTDWSCEYYSSLQNKENKIKEECNLLCESFDSEFDGRFRCTGEKKMYCGCILEEKIPLKTPEKELPSEKREFIQRVIEGIGELEVSEIFEEPKPIDDKTYEIEQLIFSETNKQRNQHNLPSLEWNPKLAEVARAHSLDMVQRNFFDHINPDSEDPTDRAKKYGLKIEIAKGGVIWIGIAENIGQMPIGDIIGYGYVSSSEDVALAMVDGWMSSLGHRENILGVNYDYVGIGVARRGSVYYLTQNFQ